VSANLITNFDVRTSLPIDTRSVVADLTERDAILFKYPGLIVYVLSEDLQYYLSSDLTTWLEFGGGNVEDGDTNGQALIWNNSLELWEKSNDFSILPVTSDTVFTLKKGDDIIPAFSPINGFGILSQNTTSGIESGVSVIDLDTDSPATFLYTSGANTNVLIIDEDGIEISSDDGIISTNISIEPGEIGFDTQVLEVSGKILISDSAIANEAGQIRWDGVQFSGYNGTRWRILDNEDILVSLTPAPTVNINWNVGNIFTIVMNQNTAFTFSNLPTPGLTKEITLYLIQDGTGSRVPSFTNVSWNDGTSTPIWTPTANQYDVIKLRHIGGFTRTTGVFVGGNFTQ
jgi:hypothetical protein